MKLSATQALEILQTPRHKKQIDSVKRQESQLRVFTEDMDIEELGREVFWSSFKETMKARSARKFDRVFQFARYPLPVVQISDSILSDFYKVFDGKNRHFQISADRDITGLNKWVENNNLEQWIEEHARTVLKNKPCYFVVIDKDDTGKPYLITVDSERLIDADFKNKKGELEYIAFTHSYGTDEAGAKYVKYSVYDEETYFVFIQYENSNTYTLFSEFKHNVGYCPSVAFLSQPTNGKNLFKRRVAFSSALSKMEDWSYFDIFRNYVDHYAPFPITEAPAKKCPNPDCTNGKIKSEILDPANPEAKPQIAYSDCDICKASDGDLMMPGTHVGINVVRDKNQNDGSGVTKMIFPDTDKMKYVPEKLDDLELEIRHKTVGLNYMQGLNEAINELQLKGSFASMESVLLRTKQELDILYKWIVTTVARSQYKDISIKVDANFGTEFYLISEDDLQRRFKESKAIGLPQEEQMQIYLQLIDTKYKGNPNKVLRQKMLIQLQPLPLYDTPEVVDMKEKGLVDPATLLLKINFLSFVSQFELENGPITQFGADLDFNQRILRIRKELELYNSEMMAKMPKPEAEKPII